MKFRTGDRVRVDKNWDNHNVIARDWNKHETRSFMIVTQIREGDNWLKFDNEEFNAEGIWWNEDCFELVEPPPLLDENLFVL